MASQSIVLRYRVQYFIITLILGPSFRIGNVPTVTAHYCTFLWQRRFVFYPVTRKPMHSTLLFTTSLHSKFGLNSFRGHCGIVLYARRPQFHKRFSCHLVFRVIKQGRSGPIPNPKESQFQFYMLATLF